MCILKYVNYDDNSYRYEYVIFSKKIRDANMPQYIKFYVIVINI
jgi:hypothetical protein